MHKRLSQPICHQFEVRESYYARLLVTAYDSIYNLMYAPYDPALPPAVVRSNAEAVLTNLHNYLQTSIKASLFDKDDN